MHAAGEGLIRRSDILFSIPSDLRVKFESFINNNKFEGGDQLYRLAQRPRNNLDAELLLLYYELRDVRVAFGDMYEMLRETEIALHALISDTLNQAYGPEDWWRRGIPEGIRKQCAASREGDPEPARHAYFYTTLIHLQEILDKQWVLFANALPKQATQSKKRLLTELVRLNHIRNSVMHPVKDVLLTEEDFSFVRDFAAKLRHDNTQIS